MSKPVVWSSPVKSHDDFGIPIRDVFIDGRTTSGQWAIMTPSSWERHGVWKLGTGFGQKYQRDAEDRFVKVEG